MDPIHLSEKRKILMKNQRGFTLVEMLIVLMIISVLLLVSLPNIAKNNKVVDSKGCEALIKLAEAQVQAYKIEKNSLPTSIDELVSEEYIQQGSCPGGELLILNLDGTVTTTDTLGVTDDPTAP